MKSVLCGSTFESTCMYTEMENRGSKSGMGVDLYVLAPSSISYRINYDISNTGSTSMMNCNQLKKMIGLLFNLFVR